jgi:hypothetical protein
LACQLYPQASGIHYAVLNQRDHHALRGLGVADACLHWLPNPAADFDALPDRMAARRKLDCHLPIDRRVVLYPVRGIRRKNLGELLLHAVLFGAHASYVCSLAPQNPVELQSYRAWERRSTALGLPIHWDTGGRYGMSFPENLAASDATITTSVAEGFGMVFLESWLAGRVLMGRDLPEITADFQAAGMDFATLAPIFHVPLDGFVSREAVTKPLQESLVGLHEAYETPLPAEAEVRDQLDALVAGDTVDFAFLTPPLQAGLIERVAERPAERQRLRDVNPTLSAAHTLADGPRDELIRRNAAIVRREYDLAALGKRLAALYTVLYDRPAAGAVTGPPHEQAIISRFLRLDRLHPTRLA